jgi:hypothetical protein
MLNIGICMKENDLYENKYVDLNYVGSEIFKLSKKKAFITKLIFVQIITQIQI